MIGVGIPLNIHIKTKKTPKLKNNWAGAKEKYNFERLYLAQASSFVTHGICESI